VCQHPDGCTRQAQDATSRRCTRHGGGKRCSEDGCTKLQQRSTGYCIMHGGGKRCEHEGGCNKSAQGNTGRCAKHGGGKRCEFIGCYRGARGTGSAKQFCITHSGSSKRALSAALIAEAEANRLKMPAHVAAISQALQNAVSAHVAVSAELSSLPSAAAVVQSAPTSFDAPPN